jgi:hypothetical protein
MDLSYSASALVQPQGTGLENLESQSSVAALPELPRLELSGVPR